MKSKNPLNFLAIAKEHLERIIKDYSKSSKGINNLINSILIIPDEYNGEDLKTDLPNASRIVSRHNIFISTSKLKFELLSASFDKNFNLKLRYICEVLDDEIEYQDDFIFDLRLKDGVWKAKRLRTN
jgi:hypothetical protein